MVAVQQQEEVRRKQEAEDNMTSLELSMKVTKTMHAQHPHFQLQQLIAHSRGPNIGDSQVPLRR